MIKQFTKYFLQSVAGMVGISVYILADTFLSPCIREQTDWLF